jgi:drug/metabolite transporter (DMT)-like permease
LFYFKKWNRNIKYNQKIVNFAYLYGMNTSKITLRNAYLQIHLCVFLWGFTAILGKLILLSGVVLVWWRILITILAFAMLPQVRESIVTLSKKTTWKLLGIGCIIMVHWVGFFASIKASNASVAVSCLSTTPFLTALLEPLLTQQKVNWREILLGAAIIPGMYLVFGFVPTSFYLGIGLGLGSAMAAAIFSTLNKIVVDNDEVSPYAVSFVELSGGFLGLSLLLPFYLWYSDAIFIPVTSDWFWLIILALLCTMFTFIVSLNSLKHLSAFTSNLVISLEPVYGIIMAWLFFSENKDLHHNFYYGMVWVLLVVFVHPFLKKR